MVGSSWPSAASCGQVAAEVIERRGLGLLLRTWRSGSLEGPRRLGVAAGAAADACGMSLPRSRSVSARACSRLTPGVGEHLGRDALLLAQQAEQQVLGADVGVVELAGLAHGSSSTFLAREVYGRSGPVAAAAFPFLTVSSIFCWIVLEVDVRGWSARRRRRPRPRGSGRAGCARCRRIRGAAGPPLRGPSAGPSARVGEVVIHIKDLCLLISDVSRRSDRIAVARLMSRSVAFRLRPAATSRCAGCELISILLMR